jgi:glyoxylase-like metal-dependent hydrolase (beta-lactamase superfamily II)
MRRLTILTVALAVAGLTPAHAQRDFSKVEIKATSVAPGIIMLEGAGGNIGLSVGADGAFVIDDQFAPLADKIGAAIAAATPKPVRFVLNTHWHFDHTGGNESLGGGGALIVAHDNVRARLKQGMKNEEMGWSVDPAPAAALPVVTFSDDVTFHWNGYTIRAHHPAPAHTDGDAIIRFVEANVVHMGDIYFQGGYPFIDLQSGGSLDGVIAAQEGVLATIDDETKIIPGHGPLSNKAELESTIAVLKDVRTRVKKLVDRGLSEEATVKADPLKDLNPVWGGGFIKGEAMTRTAYRSLKND